MYSYTNGHLENNLSLKIVGKCVIKVKNKKKMTQS